MSNRIYSRTRKLRSESKVNRWEAEMWIITVVVLLIAIMIINYFLIEGKIKP